MTRFAPLLQQASARLDLPQPTKSRILMEMAGDLDDLFQHHMAQGLDEAEAARLAEEAFALDEDSLKYLMKIHRSAVERFGDALAGQAATWWEKMLLLLLVGFVLLLAMGAAFQQDLLSSATVFLWPVLGLAVIAFAFVVVKLGRLVRRRDLDLRRFRRGLWWLLFLALAMLTTGFFGLTLEFCRHMYRLGQAPVLEDMRGPTGYWLERVAVTMNITMLTAILTAIVWFLLINLAARLEKRRAAELLEVS